MKFMVCNDGSPASGYALETIAQGLLRESDKLYVALAWSQVKEEYLPYNLKLHYIQEQNETDYTYLTDRFHFIAEEIREEDTAKSVLTSMAKDHEIDISVVGYHGRKGEKADPTIMGSAVQYMALNSHTPTMIVKKSIKSDERPNGYNLGICIDGSVKSMKALELLCQLRSPKDKIEVLICEQSNIDTS
jgi:nucleotide-binding universal stress UspA family protein